MIKIWVDDERPAPEGYDVCVTSVEDAIKELTIAYAVSATVEISLDHDAGCQGGIAMIILKFLTCWKNAAIVALPGIDSLKTK